MHIVHAFLHFTSLGTRKVRSWCDKGDSENNEDSRPASAAPDETTGLLLDPAANNNNNNSNASLTTEYENFAQSYKALLLLLFHASVYYALALAGYCLFVENWTVIQSLYYATVLFTTIGYGDYCPSSDLSRLYTIFLALYGIVILGILIGNVGQFVVDRHDEAVRRRRKTMSTSVVHAIGFERDAGDVEKELLTARTQEELRERSLWEDIWLVVVLEGPILLFLFLISLGVGFFEGWSVMESTYWLVITGTTVGLGDMHPSLPGTELFACFFFPLLVAVLGEVLARIASVYMERKERETELEFLSRTLTLTDINRMDVDRSGYVDKAEFLAYMLVALQKVDQEDVDEISELFHKLDVTNNNCLSKDDLKGREEHVRTSWMTNAPPFLQASFRGREEEQQQQRSVN